MSKVLQDLTILRAGIADAGDITGIITVYTPHDSGAVAVVSDAETDLDTTAAALNTLVDEVRTLKTEVTDLQTQLNLLLQTLRDHGIIAS